MRFSNQSRRGSVLAVLIVVLVLMGLVVAGTIRPLRDEASLTTMRVETVRAFYAAESGSIVIIQGYLGQVPMPVEGTQIALNDQTVVFTQIPELGGVAVVHGLSGDSVRRIELELQ